MVRILVPLLISTVITGYKLQSNEPESALFDVNENDPGSAMYDSDYPVDQELDNDPGSAALSDFEFGLDFPFAGEN